MIEGHGDDSYKFERPITANFSSNVYNRVDLSGLQAHLCSCISGISSYPEPEPYTLEGRLAEKYHLTATSVCVTNGATEAIYLIAQTFVVLIQPFFNLHSASMLTLAACMVIG